MRKEWDSDMHILQYSMCMCENQFWVEIQTQIKDNSD